MAEIANQLRLVVYPIIIHIIYRVLAPSQVVGRILPSTVSMQKNEEHFPFQYHQRWVVCTVQPGKLTPGTLEDHRSFEKEESSSKPSWFWFQVNLAGGLFQPTWKILYARQIGSFPPGIGVNIKNSWNHHPVIFRVVLLLILQNCLNQWFSIIQFICHSSLREVWVIRYETVTHISFL